MNLILLHRQHDVTTTTPNDDAPVPDNSSNNGDATTDTPLIDDNKAATAVSDTLAPSLFELPASDPRAKHILQHLKKSKGDAVRVGIFPHGPIGLAHIVSSSVAAVQLVVDTSTLKLPPQRPLVRILIGVPYPKVIKALWPVLASLGVDHIAYAKAELTEPAFMETSSLTEKVYQPLVREGLAQGEDTRPPTVTVYSKMTSILDLLSNTTTKPNVVETSPRAAAATHPSLETLAADCVKIVLHIDDDETAAATQQTIRQCYLQRQQQQSSSSNNSTESEGILLAIGPERGWTHQEAAAFGQAGFVQASLGRAILRTDTAVVAAVALSRDVLDEQQQESSSRLQKLELQQSKMIPAKRKRPDA